MLITTGTALLRGIILGLAIAAPVGPIGVLCIRRTLTEGRWRGFVTGMGAATADATYGAVAAFGLTAITAFLLDQRLWIHLVGAAFLAYLGVRTFFSAPVPLAASAGQGQASATTRSFLGIYLGTFLLTLSNPTTILSFLAIFAGIGVANGQGSWLPTASLVLGVFAGSSLWWLFLSTITSLFRERFSASALRWVNRISGVILVGFAIFALASSGLFPL